MQTQENMKEKALKYRAELLDAIDNFQKSVNSYILSGDDELHSWQPKIDTRFNELRATFRTLDSWWDSVIEANEENQ